MPLLPCSLGLLGAAGGCDGGHWWTCALHPPYPYTPRAPIPPVPPPLPSLAHTHTRVPHPRPRAQLKKAGDKDMDDIRTLMEEVDMRIAETKKDTYEFKRDIIIGAENPRSGKIVAEKMIK